MENNNTTDAISQYKLLASDAKFQITYIDDLYQFDFKNLVDTLNEMENLRDSIIKN